MQNVLKQAGFELINVRNRVYCFENESLRLDMNLRDRTIKLSKPFGDEALEESLNQLLRFMNFDFSKRRIYVRGNEFFITHEDLELECTDSVVFENVESRLWADALEYYLERVENGE